MVTETMAINPEDLAELEILEEKELLETARPFMASGLVGSIHTPHQALTPKGIRRHALQSVFFKMAKELGMETPAIISLNLPWFSKDQDQEKVIQAFKGKVRKLLEAANLEILNGTPGNRVNIYVAKRDARGVTFLPDIQESPQRSDSGYIVDPLALLGRVNKRGKHMTVSMASLLQLGGSRWPHLRTPLRTLTMEKRDTGTAGDGGGYMSATLARQLLEKGGLKTKRPLVGVQFVSIGRDFSFKGFVQTIPDEKMAGEAADIILDEESINRQLRNRRRTGIKLNPMFRHRNDRWVYLEPLNLGENAFRFFDYREVAKVAEQLTDRMDQESWQQAILGQEDLVSRILEECLQDEDAKRQQSHRAETYRSMAFAKGKDDNPLIETMGMAGNNPFASPEICRLMSGKTAQKVKTKHGNAKKRQTKYFFVPEEKIRPEHKILARKGEEYLVRGEGFTQMPGAVMSGERVFLVNPEYRKITEPRPGYARLMWDEADEDELIAAGMRRSDMRKYRNALDGADTDGDEVILIFYRDERNVAHVRMYRLPSSIDGGISLRLNQKDVAKLTRLGYHFYSLRKNGGPKWPGLHETDEQGNDLYPAVLKPVPMDHTPTFRNDEDGILENILEMEKYRHIIGACCNLAANLDMAGIYDPSRHKFLQSDIIDSVMYLSGDPSGIPDFLAEEMYEHVQAGGAVDPCVYWRIIKRMEAIHEERRKTDPKAYPPIPLEMKCQEHHEPLKARMDAIIQHLEARSRERQNWSHGPVDWLFREFPEELVPIVQEAVETRNTIWSERYTMDRDIPQDTSSQERSFQIAKNMESAYELEKEAVTQAYGKALLTPGYEPGSFTALFFRIITGEHRRFERTKTRRDGSTRLEKMGLEPIKTRGTLILPQEEREAFYQYRAIVPTTVVRIAQHTNIPEGTRCQVKKEGKKYFLMTPEGRKIQRLAQPAPQCRGLELQVMGYLPQVKSTRPDGEEWTSTMENLLVLTTDSWESIGLAQE
jgi:hypothetical protein